jgi:hypothetical protein
MPKSVVRPIAFVELDTTTLVHGTYVFFTQTNAALVIIRFVNTSANPVFISYDGGITTHDVCFPGGFLLYDFQTNSIPAAQSCVLPKGTTIWVQGDPSAGFFGMSGYFQPFN